MKITLCASQKTLTITFPDDCWVFGRFGALSPGLTYCFNPSRHTNAFLVDCQESRHPSCTELSHAQICLQHIDYALSCDGYDLSYLTHFHFRVTIPWILLIISGVVISFG